MLCSSYNSPASTQKPPTRSQVSCSDIKIKKTSRHKAQQIALQRQPAQNLIFLPAHSSPECGDSASFPPEPHQEQGRDNLLSAQSRTKTLWSAMYKQLPKRRHAYYVNVNPPTARPASLSLSFLSPAAQNFWWSTTSCTCKKIRPLVVRIYAIPARH